MTVTFKEGAKPADVLRALGVPAVQAESALTSRVELCLLFETLTTPAARKEAAEVIVAYCFLRARAGSKSASVKEIIELNQLYRKTYCLGDQTPLMRESIINAFIRNVRDL